jgi:hypothetical protein
MPRGPNRQRRYVAVSPLARIPDRFSQHGVKLALGEFLTPLLWPDVDNVNIAKVVPGCDEGSDGVRITWG